MVSGPLNDAESSCWIDHSAQTGSSVTRSKRTFVSIRITSLFAAGQRHDFIGAEPFAGATAQCREPACLSAGIELDQNHAPSLVEFELHRAAGFDAETVTHRLGDGDLAFAGDQSGHVCLGITCLRQVIHSAFPPALPWRAGAIDLVLSPASIEATVLFSDVRSFTTLSEELGPQGIISLLLVPAP